MPLFRRRPRVPAPPVDTPPPDDPTIGVLDARLRVIEEELAAVAGGASLCSISRSAGSVPSAKYLEGRMSALRELRRAARRRSVAGPADLLESADELVSVWRAELNRLVARGAGPDWLAYRAGGVDELDELLAALAARDPDPPADLRG